MKKLVIALCVFCLMSSCEKGRILKEYDKVSNVWILKSTIAMPAELLSEIQSIDMSMCKPKRKQVGAEGFGCNASVNDSEAFGLTISYALQSNSKLLISRVSDLVIPEPGTVVSREPTAAEKVLNDALSGEWDYVIEGEKMTWVQGEKSLVFSVN